MLKDKASTLPQQKPAEIDIRFAEARPGERLSSLDLKEISVNGENIVHMVNRLSFDLTAGDLVVVNLQLVANRLEIEGLREAGLEMNVIEFDATRREAS